MSTFLPNVEARLRIHVCRANCHSGNVVLEVVYEVTEPGVEIKQNERAVVKGGGNARIVDGGMAEVYFGGYASVFDGGTANCGATEYSTTSKLEREV